MDNPCYCTKLKTIEEHEHYYLKECVNCGMRYKIPKDKDLNNWETGTKLGQVDASDPYLREYMSK